MHGPDILVRSISQLKDPDKKYGNRWQYNPRSDRHSKAACWAIMFDLLRHSAGLRDQTTRGRVAFGINHQMRDFKTGREKNLDLVVCTPGTRPTRWKPSAGTFCKLATRFGIELTEEEKSLLDGLPDLREDVVGEVHIALEAKACMTEHLKALPRLYDELSSSHLTIHGNSPYAIAAGFVMVNIKDRFVSPDRNKWSLLNRVADATTHDQPRVTERVIEKIKEIQRRGSTGEVGFDALGLVVVGCVNDGTPVEIVEEPPAPQPQQLLHYDSMIRRIAKLYESRFPHE